ncbi:MAG: acetyl-CoA hydrolase/transferase C-terminal domain-containing protein, partial [Oscillospiraceae bacterium]
CNVGAYQVCTHEVITQDPRVKKKIGFIDATGQYAVPGEKETHYIHISEFDCIVESNSELVAIPSAPPSDLDEKIASFITPYIHEGDKIQIGFGGLGEEILKNLRGIGKVEVYSEVACESMMDLCKEGIITKITCSSPAACSKEFFEWASSDKRIQFRSQRECIDALGIVGQENLVAINATFMIDLLGQACSEAQGLTPYSGPGGSFGYLYGAIRSKGGRSFVCLRSTYVDREGERHSNVLPWLPQGCIVTTPKVFVMNIVTEWGVADVFMKTLKDRIKAIIKVAHPDYRKELIEQICTTDLISEEDFEGYVC